MDTVKKEYQTPTKFYPTDFKEENKDYPYGRLRCTRFQWVEFSPGKGFRSVTQTINPKNGRLNAPKKSTYTPILCLCEDPETGYVTPYGFSFYKLENLNRQTDWLAQHSDLFTVEQRQYIFGQLLQYLIVTKHAQVAYCGAKMEDVEPLLAAAIAAAQEGFKTGDGLIFASVGIKVNAEAVDATKVPDFSPFKVVNYGV